MKGPVAANACDPEPRKFTSVCLRPTSMQFRLCDNYVWEIQCFHGREYSGDILLGSVAVWTV
jgi:hypothetical protein